MKPYVSVVMSTYNRGHLLSLSIEGWNRSQFDLSRTEFCIVDDGSEDGSEALLDKFDSRFDVKWIKLRKTPGLWRDVAATINVGIRAAKGETIFCVHPEVIPGRRSLQFVADTAREDNVWAACRVYYLSPTDQDNLNKVNWIEDGPLAFRNLPDFYAPRDGHPDYHPSVTDQVAKPGFRIPTWESWVASAMSRRTWSNTGAFIESSAWGSCDLLWVQRRHKLGIRNVTSPDDETICGHFNHDRPFGKFVPTNRDMQAAFAQAPNLTPNQCRWPAVDHLWGPIP